jgi:GH15 family glucan-1,4-alpha-glucosidase
MRPHGSARLAGPFKLSRPLAGDGRPFGHHPEADDLRAYRRPGRGADRRAARYNPSASPDGLRGDEGTFSLCTFWYVDALARAGRLDDARLTFEKMHTYANRLGLYSEEISSTGEQLGNFPQAFSHLSLISAAVNLDRQLDGGAG